MIFITNISRPATGNRKRLAPAFLLTLGFIASPTIASAQAAASIELQQPNADKRRLSPDAVRKVAPTLEQYTQQHLYGEVWKRPGLSVRDRSLVTIAAMIARGEAPALRYYAAQGIENGLKPSEISETITHLAFYTGWGKAMAAVGPVGEVFAEHGISATDLPPAFGPLEPLDQAKDAPRRRGVEEKFATVSPGVVHYTNGLLFEELWQRPYLSQRDRSVVTVAALIADGKSEQLPYHLNRAMDQELTEAQAGEILTQLAFYAGWPCVFSALPVAKKVFADRKTAHATQ